MLDYRRETHGKGWSTNFYQNHNWINMTGLAAAGYALQGEDEAAAQYIQEAKEDFARVFALMPEDGSNYEGATYWRYGRDVAVCLCPSAEVQESWIGSRRANISKIPSTTGFISPVRT